jgi:hypothetical protein
VADAIVWPVERVFGWSIDVPVLVRDYVAVGLVLFLSFARATNLTGERALIVVRHREQRRLTLLMLLSCLVAWPIVALLMLLILPIVIPLMTRYVDEQGLPREGLGKRRQAMVLTLLPLVYLGLLLAVNYLILT